MAVFRGTLVSVLNEEQVDKALAAAKKHPAYKAMVSSVGSKGKGKGGGGGGDAGGHKAVRSSYMVCGGGGAGGAQRGRSKVPALVQRQLHACARQAGSPASG